MPKKWIRAWLLIAIIGLPLALAGAPRSFQKLANVQWNVFEVREDVDYGRAWNTVLDILINDFDLEMVSREEGYARTGWLHSYGGPYNHEYRVRVIVRFAPDRRSLRLKAEAQVRDGENWITGIDSRLLTTLKTDLMGTIGRTTR